MVFCELKLQRGSYEFLSMPLGLGLIRWGGTMQGDQELNEEYDIIKMKCR